jgi:AcrR family transcriptional regulator
VSQRTDPASRDRPCPPGRAPAPRGRGRPASAAPSGRTRLLEAGLELFGRHGFAATTIDELVTRAGVTPPVLYHHFGTKSGLYVELAESVYAELLAELDAALPATGRFDELVDALLELAVRLHAAQPLLAPMVHSVVIDTLRDPELAALLLPTQRRFRAFFDRVAAAAPPELRAGAGARRDLARALVAIVNGLNVTASTAPDVDSYRRTAGALAALLRTGTGPQPSPDPVR